MSFIKLILILVLVHNDVLGRIIPKEEQGYPQGYLNDCPGSTKPAFISAKALKYFGIEVVGGDGSLRRSYNYYQAKEISKDKDLDFKNRKTIFFFGGFGDNPNLIVSGTMAYIYRRLGYNVLLMNIHLFIMVHYPVAPRFLPTIGRRMAEMLTNLTADGLDLKDLEFAGVSLGAQVMSFTAKSFREITGRNVSKLIGLDPAGPCYRSRGPDLRLDASDGDFVLVIQTNIDGFGMAAPVGHVNFYVNGGEYQPSDLVVWMPCTFMCSHVRAYTIWYAALESPDYFIGIKCDSVQQARRHQCYDRVPRETNVISNTKVNKTNTGIFYVATDNNFPYYLGIKGLKKENQFWNKTILAMNKDDVAKI